MRHCNIIIRYRNNNKSKLKVELICIFGGCSICLVCKLINRRNIEVKFQKRRIKINRSIVKLKKRIFCNAQCVRFCKLYTSYYCLTSFDVPLVDSEFYPSLIRTSRHLLVIIILLLCYFAALARREQST